MVVAACDLATDHRTRLAVASYIAVACATGLRVSSLLENRVTHGLAHRQGARWRHLTFFLLRSEVMGQSPHVVAWYQPPFCKTLLGRTMSFPLHEGRHLAVSPSNLLLLAAEADGCLPHRISYYLDPAYLGGRENRAIVLREEWYVHECGRSNLTGSKDEFVFRTSNGACLSRDALERHLKTISETLGFDIIVRSRAFRHFVARAIYFSSE